MSTRYESSGAPSVVNDQEVTTFWLAADADDPYSEEQEVTTTTVSLSAPVLTPVLGRIAQTANYVMSVEPLATGGGRFVRAPLDLATEPAVITPDVAFAAPAVIAAEAARFLLFGDTNRVYESPDGQAWTLVGLMAGDPFPVTIAGVGTYCVTKIGSRWFLSFGILGAAGGDALFYSDDADAQTGWTACTGLAVGSTASLHEEIVFDGTDHYAAVTDFASGETVIYASSDGGASWAAEETLGYSTGFETSTSGTASALMFQFQVTGTTGSDYVRAYLLNGVVFEKLVGTTTWTPKASGLVNPYYGATYGASMAVTDQASVHAPSTLTQIRHETAGVFTLSSGF